MATTIAGYEGVTAGTQKSVTVTQLDGAVGLDVTLVANVAGKALPQVDVNIQDQTTTTIDLYLNQMLNSGALLGSPIAADDKVITLVGGHGAVVGNCLCVKEGSSFYQGIITNVAVNNITVDTPFDVAHTTAAEVEIGNINLNINGSVTPVVFEVGPLVGSGDKWDITRMQGAIRDATAMDDGLFGGVTALTNGVYFRRNNGTAKNLFNIKTNGDIRLRSDEANYAAKAKSGEYGISFTRTWAGQENSGVTLRLDSADGDTFQAIVQDDLTGLIEFNIIIQGHVVE
jgi:hypothetical protein